MSDDVHNMIARERESPKRVATGGSLFFQNTLAKIYQLPWTQGLKIYSN